MFFDTEMTPFLTPLGCLKWYPHLGPFWGIPPYMVKPLYGSQKQGPKLPLSPLPPLQVSPRAHLELRAGSFFGTLLSDWDHSVTTVKELRPRGLALGLGGPSCSGSNFAARFSRGIKLRIENRNKRISRV